MNKYCTSYHNGKCDTGTTCYYKKEICCHDCKEENCSFSAETIPPCADSIPSDYDKNIVNIKFDKAKKAFVIGDGIVFLPLDILFAQGLLAYDFFRKCPSEFGLHGSKSDDCIDKSCNTCWKKSLIEAIDNV